MRAGWGCIVCEEDFLGERRSLKEGREKWTGTWERIGASEGEFAGFLCPCSSSREYKEMAGAFFFLLVSGFFAVICRTPSCQVSLFCWLSWDVVEA